MMLAKLKGVVWINYKIAFIAKHNTNIQHKKHKNSENYHFCCKYIYKKTKGH